MGRLIDADALLKKKDIITINDGNRASVVGIVYEDDIEEAPTVDAVEIVRCGDCKWQRDCEESVGSEYYCADGVRKDADRSD